MRIEDEVRTSHRYDSASDAGIAVDLLVPILNPEQLVEHAVALLYSTSKLDVGDYSFGDGRFRTLEGGDSVRGDEVGLWPIAQAIWRLDQRLDAEAEKKAVTSDPAEISKRGLFAAIHPEEDNIVEQRITPQIMKLSYGNNQRLAYAALLGGSSYEEFLLRNDWRRIATEGGGDDVDLGHSQNYVNGWFHKLLWLRSPLGTAFRDQQSDAILKYCRNGLSEFSMMTASFPKELDFVFWDCQFSKRHPSLAMRFWPELDGRVKAQPSYSREQTLKMRWDYLTRLWPESTPEMFQSALRDATSLNEHLNIPNMPDVLSADAQFQILEMLLESESVRFKGLPADATSSSGGPKYFGKQVLLQLRNQIFGLPCEVAGQKLVGELNLDPKHEYWGMLPSFLSNNRQNEDLLRLLVESGNPRMQLITLPAIEHHPIPGRVELLERLLAAEAVDVRDAASVVMQRLEKLRNRQFTPRASLELKHTPPGPQ